MTVQTINNTMLYCPKCQETYEDGSQRFCTNEGERLLTSPSAGKSSKYTEGVFTTILNRRAGEKEDKFSAAPGFPKAKTQNFSSAGFRPPTDSKIFVAEEDSILELEPPPVEPFPPIFKSEDVPVLQISKSETGTTDENVALSADSDNLLGQTIKDRYEILELIKKDESGIVYLAEDTLVADKNYFVKILTDEDAGDNLADERITLASINHPNLAGVIDAGELPGSELFIVSEFVEGETVADYLRKHGQFNASRTARIIQQASEALSEVHQSDVVHRNLKPENIVLAIDENGKEIVKLTNFGEPRERLNKINLLYKSPEQVEGKAANFTSDNYSLAVIAYQMLTNRLPFNASSVGDLLKAQREGLKLLPSSLRIELSPSVDKIIEKALSFNPFERYTKSSEFGAAFFEAVASGTAQEAETAAEEDAAKSVEPVSFVKVEEDENKPDVIVKDENSIVNHSPVISDVESFDKIFVEEDEDLIKSVKATKELAWEKRSPELPKDGGNNRSTLSLIGVAILLAALLGVWYYFINRPDENQFVQTPPLDQNAQTAENPALEATIQPALPTPEEVEPIPLPRTISPPPDTIYFQNSKEKLKGDAMKNFLGFSLYYPEDWKLNPIVPEEKNSKNRSKFLDISKDASSGTPVEQFLVSYYNSKGTFKADADIFPSLVKETNATLQKIVPNYQMISEGEKTVNNGWRAYEVKFSGSGVTSNGEKITLWGKRLYIPTAMRGMKNGYVITMLATSLSKDVKSVDDVGVKGELSNILATFEPNQNF